MALVQRTVTIILKLGLTVLRVLFTSPGVEVPDDLPTISSRIVDEASGGVAEVPGSHAARALLQRNCPV